MKTFKKALAVVMCVVMTLTAAPLGGLVGLELPSLFDFKAEAAPYSGTCGDNLKWSLDKSTGVLEITGTGAMKDYSIDDYLFTPWMYHDDEIKTVNIGNGVTSIGNEAFESCLCLKSITIPNSVTSIGNYAFNECKSLKSVYYTGDISGWCGINFDDVCANPMCYADNLYIGETRLEGDIVIPGGVTSIGRDTFRGCSLTSITIPDTVTSIDNGALLHSGILTNIIVDKNNKNYSSDEHGVLFNKDKTKLIQYPIGNARTSYTIPDTVTSINEGAFRTCDSLTSVTITDSVTSIGEGAFWFCDSLTSVIITNSVTSIGEDAFNYCTSLSDVYYNGCSKDWAKIVIGTGNTYLTNATKHYDYYYINWAVDGNIIEERVEVGDSIVVPADPEKDYYTFTGWDSEIPDIMPESDLTITALFTPITYYAEFVVDGNLVGTVPYTVESETIEAPEVPPVVGYTGAWEDYELTPGGITVNAVYTANPHTVTWVIDGEEKIVDDYGYGDEIVKPANPEKEGHTFTGWDKEIVSTVPDEDLVYTATWKKNSYTVKWNIDGVITEEPYVYGDEITAPVPEKDGMFFVGWGEVVPETMPAENLEFIAQWNKTNFEYEKDENGNITITGAKNAVGDVEIPDNINGYPVTSIAEAAFAGSNITSVTIPEGVETIGECAFAYCENLKAVNIPASVTKLGETAFVGSTNIEKIDISADNESYATDEYGVIYNKDFSLLIYAPAKSVGEAYTMRSTTATACELSFADCTDFALTLSDGFSVDSNSMFFDVLSVTGFVTGKNCVNYKAIDGVLYNKAVTTLIKYPVDSKRELLILPAGVEYIADEYAFVTPEIEKSIIVLFGLDYDSNTFANMYREPEYLTVHIDSFYDFDSDSLVFLMMGPSHVCFGDTTKSENDQLNEIADNAIANIESQWEEKKDELTPGSIEYYYNEAFVLGYVDLITSYIDCQNDHTRLHKYAQVVETKDPTCAVDGYVNYD